MTGVRRIVTKNTMGNIDRDIVRGA